MRQSDIFTLVLIAGIGTLAAYFVCDSLLGDPKEAVVKYKTISQEVSNVLLSPDPEVFNSAAINPTVEVYVGDCEDRDKNGILDESEIRYCQCVQYDSDTDGVIDDDEYKICLNGGSQEGEDGGEEQPEGE